MNSSAPQHLHAQPWDAETDRMENKYMEEKSEEATRAENDVTLPLTNGEKRGMQYWT